RLHHERRLGDAQSGAPVGFRHGNPEPTGLRQRFVKFVREMPVGVAGEPIVIPEACADLEHTVANILLAGDARQAHAHPLPVRGLVCTPPATLAWGTAALHRPRAFPPETTPGREQDWTFAR